MNPLLCWNAEYLSAKRISHSSVKCMFTSVWDGFQGRVGHPEIVESVDFTSVADGFQEGGRSPGNCDSFCFTSVSTGSQGCVGHPEMVE